MILVKLPTGNFYEIYACPSYLASRAGFPDILKLKGGVEISVLVENDLLSTLMT